MIGLQGNQLAGTISSFTFESLILLERLYLSDNRLAGSIPSLFGSAQFTYLDFTNNKLTGTIPTPFGRRPQLRDLALSDNQLTGTIPSEFGTYARLETLSLWGNHLTGTIPSSFGNLVNLKLLELYDNSKLGGTIPKELCNNGNEYYSIEIIIDCTGGAKIECACCTCWRGDDHLVDQNSSTVATLSTQ